MWNDNGIDPIELDNYKMDNGGVKGFPGAEAKEDVMYRQDLKLQMGKHINLDPQETSKSADRSGLKK